LAAERVAIIGAGIAGLATALALKRSGRDIVIVERDPEPPSISPEAAFDAWQRPGVPQFRHAHVLLSRIQTILRDHHPELLAELRHAGLELSSMAEALPAGQRDNYQPMPDDGDLLHLWGRRPTFEYVLRRHVERLQGVRFVHSARVLGLVTESTKRHVRVRGIEIARSGSREVIDADVVVDASGKRTKSRQWLEAQGVRTEVDSNPSGFVYACRHYRWKDPAAPRSLLDSGGNLDYLGYAAFFAEHGTYALTMGCPVEEKELADAMHRTEGFEALCAELPAFKEWALQSEPTSKVLGAGRFENRWTSYGVRGGRELFGFFAVGDSHLETNPMYGRGCASAFIQAQVFAEALDATGDPGRRAHLYYDRTRALLQHYFDLSVATDRMYRNRARVSRGLSIPWPARLLNYLFEAAWLPAVHGSALVAREFVKAVQMREVSRPAVRLAVTFQILLALIRGWFRRGKAPPWHPGPPRSELLHRLPAPRHGAVSP
jgi:2-polyprenyl-6-methoxyphenol hydroxylase-like FAD-dependent oxidoreductase